MAASSEHRTFKRIPFGQRVRVVAVGRVVVYAAAINLGMVGVLLKASPAIPLGGRCRLELPPGRGEGRRILAEGTVIRSDAGGTAIQFANPLDRDGFQSLASAAARLSFRNLATAYRDYFRVSRERDLADCERLLGVTKRAFRTTFSLTFASCMGAAILPLWLLRGDIPAYPNGIKVVLSFAYAGVWLGLIQPTVDLAILWYLRHRRAAASAG